MDIEGIAKELTWLAYRLDSMRSHQATVEGLETTNILREAAAILRTHPDAKPNDPLTLEELREMDGEPVWVEHYNGGEWVIVSWNIYDEIAYTRKARLSAYNYGLSDRPGWLAYRRKPEEKK